MGILYFLIYWLIGFIFIYWLAGKSSFEENSAWVLIYAIGPIIWPIIMGTYLVKY